MEFYRIFQMYFSSFFHFFFLPKIQILILKSHLCLTNYNFFGIKKVHYENVCKKASFPKNKGISKGFNELEFMYVAI